MTIQELLKQLETKRETLREVRQTASDEIAAVRTKLDERQRSDPNADLSTSEDRQVRDAQTRRDTAIREFDIIDARIGEVREEIERDRLAAQVRNDIGAGTRRSTTSASVGLEPHQYDRASAQLEGISFFRDLVASEYGDHEARDRISRHRQEVLIDGREAKQRATTTGSFAGLVPPAYLIDEAAPVLRSGRPLANAVRHRDLPATGMVAYVPKGTTGATVTSQAAENTTVSSTDEVWGNISCPIVTIAGMQDVSRQSLERGIGVDVQIFEDLLGAWAAEIDRQVLNGTGASGQLLGILNTAGTNLATAYGAAVTAGSFSNKIAGGIGAVAAPGATVRPRLIAMHPRRWAWLNGQTDNAGRPLVVPGVAGPQNAAAVNVNPGGYSGDADSNDDGGFELVGSLQGLGVITDSNMPAAFGTASEDVAIVLDNAQTVLLEDPGLPVQLRFDQTLPGQLTSRLVVYSYAAFTAARYPVSISRIGGADTSAGNGQTAPSF